MRKPRPTLQDDQFAGPRLDGELAVLFGREIFAVTVNRRPEDLIESPMRISAAAKHLLQLSASPTEQRQFVASLEPTIAAGLCAWIRNPATAIKLLAARRCADFLEVDQ